MGGNLHTYTLELWPSGVATKCLPCQGDVHGAMAVVSGYGFPTGALQRCHSHSHDITQSAKYPPEKQTS